MITNNKTKDVFLTKKQLQARIKANTLEEGAIYNTTDEPAGHALKYENGILSLLDVDGSAISSQNIQAASAGFGTPTVDNTNANQVGTASVEVTASGPDTAKIFNFKFNNLKGANGTDAQVTSQKIFDLTEDSDTVVREIDNDTGKVNIHLATTISNKVNNALQMPTTQPTELLMVGLNTNKAQTNIPLGSSLALENGHLETTIKVVKKTQSEYDALTSYDANTMYVIVG